MPENFFSTHCPAEGAIETVVICDGGHARTVLNGQRLMIFPDGKVINEHGVTLFRLDPVSAPVKTFYRVERADLSVRVPQPGDWRTVWSGESLQRAHNIAATLRPEGAHVQFKISTDNRRTWKVVEHI
jgi:hypothetical protein